MNKTAIEWCDYTWSPVTGCKHGCPYCYARKIAERFKGSKAWPQGFERVIKELERRVIEYRKDAKRIEWCGPSMVASGLEEAIALLRDGAKDGERG